MLVMPTVVISDFRERGWQIVKFSDSIAKYLMTEEQRADYYGSYGFLFYSMT